MTEPTPPPTVKLDYGGGRPARPPLPKEAGWVMLYAGILFAMLIVAAVAVAVVIVLVHR